MYVVVGANGGTVLVVLGGGCWYVYVVVGANGGTVLAVLGGGCWYVYVVVGANGGTLLVLFVWWMGCSPQTTHTTISET